MHKRIFAALLVLVGIALLAAPRSPAQTQTQTAGAFTPTRFTVVVEGAPTGPPILLLPGLTSSRAVFDAEAKILAPSYRLYRVQINGFSGQPAGPNASGPLLEPTVVELHQYLAGSHLHPAVIGHSLGGLLSLMLADEHPEDLQKLMIVDSLPFYALVFNPAANVDQVKPQAEGMRTGLLAASDAEYAAQSAQTAQYLVINPDAQKLVAASSQASDRRVMAQAMYEDLITDLRPRLASIKTPTTLLYPYDASVAPDPARIDAVYTTSYSTMPNLKIHRIDNSRHFIMYDQPAPFDVAVQAFLK